MLRGGEGNRGRTDTLRRGTMRPRELFDPIGRRPPEQDMNGSISFQHGNSVVLQGAAPLRRWVAPCLTGAPAVLKTLAEFDCLDPELRPHRLVLPNLADRPVGRLALEGELHDLLGLGTYHAVEEHGNRVP
jgi:hypothetical protein